MPEIVPALEFLHDVHAAGVPAEYWSVVGRPQEFWEALSPDVRAKLLRQRKIDVPDGAAVHVRAMKRRGRSPHAENIIMLIEVETAEGKGTASLGARRLLYSAFEPARPADSAESLSVPSAAFGPGGPQSTRRVIHLLDNVWQGEPYDLERDGPLCESVLPEGFKEVDSYWLEEPFARVRILRDADYELVYHLEEPQLSALQKALLLTLNDRLRDVLILEKDNTTFRATTLLTRLLEMLRMYRFRTDRRTAYKLGYYFIRNYLGLGPLDPIMHDPNVEDVSCNGPGLPVYVAHSRHQTLRTSLSFDEMELNSFTMKLAQRGGKLLSVAQPLVDATLPDGSRLQAALGREVTSRGSAFTIRKFREDPLTAVDLVKNGTHSLDTMAFLWLAAEMRRSMLVMGATASGKTTTLNSLSQFVPPSNKIVSIEDTREITLQHENWLAAVTREGFSQTSSERISMFDLLRAALRQRPDYLVVGEIRGAEGLTLFQAMSTGHTCFSTMHAGTVENAVYRLENAPINVPRVMLTSLDYFLIQGQVEVKGQTVRRLLGITEVDGLDAQTRNVRMNEVFRYDPVADTMALVGQSRVLDQARVKGGWTRARLDEEISARRRVLERLVQRDERHYSQVAKAVRRFYSDQAEGHGWTRETVVAPSIALSQPAAAAAAPDGAASPNVRLTNEPKR